ncbi:hypothetical protein [Candidatus Soleaferrea massiliensis]|uniref:hypothetical protein n=1 Tax=Candidatus Soleaferrea massiliensis TaxID=1470354 RepID=UPI00058E1D7F|nr:hypothetical protein [Candidatus Soleaferrea massiliensis]
MCMHEDDSDIKIAPGHFEQHVELDCDEEADEFLTEKNNGNIAKAHDLGYKLAEEVLREDGESLFGIDDTEDRLAIKHRRILFAYAVDISLEEYLPNSLTAQTALNSFYDHLKESAPLLYNDISESGAFTLYILCRRTHTDHIEDCIGRTFAKLCEQEDVKSYQALGSALFDKYITTTERIIGKFQFAS